MVLFYLAGYDGDVLFRLEVSDGWVSNFSDSLSFKFEYSVSDTMSWRGATVALRHEPS